MSDVRYPVIATDPITGLPKEGVNFKLSSDGGVTFVPDASGVNTNVQGEAFIDVPDTAQYTLYIDGSPSTLYQDQTIIPLNDDGKIKTEDIEDGFSIDQTFHVTDTSLVPTEFGDAMKWDSTVDGAVTMKYRMSQSPFGFDQRVSMGQIQILIHGNTTFRINLSDTNRFEGNLNTDTTLEFSADVLDDECRLLYDTDRDTSIIFFNITYVSFVNNV